MLARLQRALTLTLITLVLLWVTFALGRGWPLLAGAGALALLFGHAGFLGLEFAIMVRVNAAHHEPATRLAAVLAAWGGETLTAPKLFCWWQPFRSEQVPDHLPARPPSGHAPPRGVVFVHGLVCNRGMWNPWMQRLRERGVPFIAVNLEPVFGSLDDYPRIVESAVARMVAATGTAPVMVGHSMGGLVVRGWLAAHGGPARVHRVITIGAPHHGTWLGRFAASPNAREMRLGSAWLRELASREDAGTAGHFTCFFGHCDNIVFPASTATLQGADNRHLPSKGHVQMAYQQEVFDEIWRWAQPAFAMRAAASPSATQVTR